MKNRFIWLTIANFKSIQVYLTRIDYLVRVYYLLVHFSMKKKGMKVITIPDTVNTVIVDVIIVSSEFPRHRAAHTHVLNKQPIESDPFLHKIWMFDVKFYLRKTYFFYCATHRCTFYRTYRGNAGEEGFRRYIIVRFVRPRLQPGCTKVNFTYCGHVKWCSANR